MTRNTRRTQRGETSLSRDSIIEAAIALLDAGGEAGLTFRALSERLATGAGAIYWHVADKGDLLDAACDAVVARTMAAAADSATPRERMRAIGVGMFDALDAHPWIGAELARSPGALPMVRILEGIGGQVRALGVPSQGQWLAASTLLNYILGVAGQNAANARVARRLGGERPALLESVAAAWLRLDEDAYAFTRSVAAQLREHDDRADFMAGIDLILDGIEQARRPPP
ncbi:TetR family transcriptional regulator [Massilia forsythiae]|uniref:TetR family transcriptional regulator n=1 Tax=Massilia forsythiae TaxID=2728020 RepID=A0A7Z2ZTX8_9BURK|nr:TetR family transcriptional regulator [Massilia forsythiae]QJE01839.1 TetR family transcriptional regulator [Massilia forsythiae]